MSHIKHSLNTYGILENELILQQQTDILVSDLISCFHIMHTVSHDSLSTNHCKWDIVLIVQVDR